MGDYELLNFSDPEALADAAAGDWLRQIANANRQGAPHRVALCGGRIARRFFAAAAVRAKAEAVSLKQVHFFWSDERCVPPTDPESNYALAREYLLQPLAIPADHIHRLRGEVAPEVAAAEGEAEIRHYAGMNAGQQPILELVFLGLGEDGHVASLFPNEPEAASASQGVFRPVLAPKPPPRRITLGYPAVASAREVWVLASGPGKAEALGKSLAPGEQTPLARVLRLREHTKIFTDIRSG